MSNIKKVLFICSGNKKRSPTGEFVFRAMGYESRSAGTSIKSVKRVSIEDVIWADLILFMEPKHYSRVFSMFPRVMNYKTFEILNILDNYEFMDADLISLLQKIKIAK